MLKKFLVLAALLIPLPALAQNVQYVSPVTRGHIPVWNTNGVIADGGSSASSPITSIGVTNNGGAGICVNSALSTASGYQALCFGASTAGAATISLQNYGTATAQSLQFIINGTVVTLPTGGAGFALENPPFVAGHASCFVSSLGVLQDCGVSVAAGTQFGLPYYSTTSTLGTTGAGSNGQFLVGQTSSVPLWKTLSGDISSISAAGTVTLGSVNGIPFNTSYTAHGVLIAEGNSAYNTITTSGVGLCLLSQGTSSDPIYGACASGAGSAGGSNTQVQFNNSTSLGGSPNFTWVSPTLTLGVAGSTGGQLGLASSTATGTVTLQAPGVSSAYNFNFPIAAGTAGQPLISGGGSTNPNSFGTLGILGGGTNCTTASGTCLDNITGFSSNGFVQRTGAGTYAFSLVVPVTSGGTSLASGTSGGILGFTGATTIASSGLLSQFGIVVGGGSGATPSSVTNGTAGQILQAQTSANPAWATMSGDVTLNSSGVATIGAGAVTVAKQANAAAYSLFGNFTGSSAAPQYSTIGALTQKASPAASDYVILQDNAAAGALKYAAVSSIASAGSVSSIAGNTGAFTLAGGVTNTVNQIQSDGNYSGFALGNCTLAASVGSNLLTVALKDNAGNDPSTTSPCNLNYRNATATTGATALIPQTAALSISTFATGATLGSSNATAFRFWVVAFNNAGTNVLGLINCSNATNIFPLNEGVAASSTAMTSGATSAGVFYTPNGTAISSKAFRILGYIEYGIGLTTAGTYATGPTIIQAFGPGIKKPGEVVQSVYASSSTAASTATTYALSATPPTTANGALAVSAPSFTATSPANLIRVTGNVIGSVTTSNNTMVGYMASGTTVIAISGETSGTGTSSMSVPLIYQSLASSSAATYALYVIGTSASSSNAINGGTAALWTGVPLSKVLAEELQG